MSAYVPLYCKSNYSFLEGASSPEELVERAHLLKLPAIAITDRDGVYGVGRAHIRAKELGIQLIIGAEITLEDDASVVLLAKNRVGYANLCRLITVGRRRSPKGECALTSLEVGEHAEGLIALWGATYSLGNGGEQVGNSAGITAQERLGILRDAFGDRLYALLLRRMQPEDAHRNDWLWRTARRLGLRAVGAVEVLYHEAVRRPLQDVLTCIRNGVSVQTAGRLLRPNAEHFLLDGAEFGRRFVDYPGAVEGTVELAGRCTFSLDELHYRYPLEDIPKGKTPIEWLRDLTLLGAEKRYGGEIPGDVRAQLER